MSEASRKGAAVRSAARVGSLYLLFGSAWVLASDRVLEWLVTDHAMVMQLQTVKGWFFVALSALLIFGLLRIELALRARAEATLAATNQKYRDFVEGSIQGMAVQRDFTVLFANTAYAKIFGFERAEDVIGTSGRALIDPAELSRVEAYYRARVAGQPAPSRYEFRARRRDGTPIWISNLVSRVTWEGAPAKLVTLVDTTEAKRAGEEARQAREAQVKAERLAVLGRLAAGIAHELRNPLSVIVGRLQLLQNQVQAGDAVAVDRIARHLPAVEEAAERMRRIMDSMSAYARPQPPAPIDLGIPDLLRHVVDLVTHQARSSRVKITTDCPDDLPRVQADGTQMIQILLNLVTNALEAIAEAGREGTLTLRGRLEAGQVIIEVADDGPGIPADTLEQIWDPFYTTRPEGTGLGLSIVRSLVAEQPGAKLAVESVEGRGTTFRVVMPAAAQAV